VTAREPTGKIPKALGLSLFILTLIDIHPYRYPLLRDVVVSVSALNYKFEAVVVLHLFDGVEQGSTGGRLNRPGNCLLDKLIVIIHYLEEKGSEVTQFVEVHCLHGLPDQLVGGGDLTGQHL